MQSISGNLDPTARICAIIVTYHPSPDLIHNVECVKPQVAEVVIVDNGSRETSEKLLLQLEKMAHIRVIRNKKNLGIATALNIGIRYAAGANYPWALTFDQDSTVTTGFVASMLAAYHACDSKENVALVSPVHCASGEQKSPNDSNQHYSFIPVAMTSGSLVKTRVLMEHGLYDEAMFIDYVDFDLCLRLRRHGFKLIQAKQASLLHHLGTQDFHSLLGFSFGLTSHNATRCYYIMRNRIAMYRRYARSFPLWVAHDLVWMMIDLAKIILFEREKRAKLRHAFKGMRHGLAGVSGAISPVTV